MLDADINPQIRIVRLTDPQMAETMSEAVLAWCLYLHRKMPDYKILQNAKQWKQLTLAQPKDCHISVFGLGKLGTRAALRLQQNGFTVRGWSQSEKSIENIETYSGPSGFESILALTNIAVILLPLTNNTHNLFNQAVLQALPSGASIINFARGPIVNEKDLLVALNDHHIDHAVLDVFSTEPLPVNSDLWSHTQVTVLPHISAPTTISTAAELAAHNLDQFIERGVIPDSVDRNKGY